MQDTLMTPKTVPVKKLIRLRIIIHGAVQGVGFRPFIYRLAVNMDLKGWVNNSTQGVFIEVEGDKEQLESFLIRIQQDKPALASIQSLESSYLDPKYFSRFEIRKSKDSGEKVALILPDIATCPDCRKEIFDPNNRRYLYPFTNCTNCGPRFSIIECLPYDRKTTTMKRFQMCDACREEYENPLDRRFHAQPNACPQCGPHLELWNRNGRVLSKKQHALLATTRAICDGKIVAVKGLGGFHLMVDARNNRAVHRLRQLKRREEKPFALMYPSVELIIQHCLVSNLEEKSLVSPATPIVILKRSASINGIENGTVEHRIAYCVTEGNPNLGIMLPYTPLHHILMKELGFPIVATSGNLSDEPICTDEQEALHRLGNIADLFLVHNRPIKRHVDDSIVRIILGREMVLRRARGYAPLPIEVDDAAPAVLAVGAHLKNTIAVSKKGKVFVSQHIGDLETPQANDAFRQVISDFKQLYEHHPKSIACDAHPDYLSTQFAHESGLPRILVQHHYAHVLACMVENDLESPLLGISWDGTGYGLDGTIWGGEFLHVDESSFIRASHFRTFHLPGGETAVEEPRRIAVGLLYEIFGRDLFSNKEILPLHAFSASELALLQEMLKKNINAPVTSSAGRLFDAVASILGLRQYTRFEGQAAMELEFALAEFKTEEAYPIRYINSNLLNSVSQKPEAHSFGCKPETRNPKLETIVDWQPMVLEILEDMKAGIPAGLISAKFHNTLAESIVRVAKLLKEEKVVLTGGCFQNKYLTERTVRRLEEEKFRPYWHQRIPPNDGGIAVGQIVAAQRAYQL